MSTPDHTFVYLFAGGQLSDRLLPENLNVPRRSWEDDIVADLDDADEYDGEDGPDECDETEETDAFMHVYLQHVRRRLHDELLTTFTGKTWLLDLLKSSEGRDDKYFWLRASKSREICRKLGISYGGEQAYYKDIKVWLPDIQYGRQYMPVCPCCMSNDKVRFLSWQANHYARRITDEHDFFYLMSRRYKCEKCEIMRKFSNADMSGAGVYVSGLRWEEVGKKQPQNAIVINNTKLSEALRSKNKLTKDQWDLFGIESLGSNMTVKAGEKWYIPVPSYSFMGYNPSSVSSLPAGKGRNLGVFLTHRHGVTMRLLDWMRPLFDKGLRPEQLSDILLEKHSKYYFDMYLQREEEIFHDRKGMMLYTGSSRPRKFGNFGDKKRYNGMVPTGNYLSNVYKWFHRTIATHLGKEVHFSVSTCLPAFLPSCLLPCCLAVFLPSCLPVCLPCCLPAFLPSCLAAFLAAFLPSCLPAFLPSCLPDFLPSCLPILLPS